MQRLNTRRYLVGFLHDEDGIDEAAFGAGKHVNRRIGRYVGEGERDLFEVVAHLGRIGRCLALTAYADAEGAFDIRPAFHPNLHDERATVEGDRTGGEAACLAARTEFDGTTSLVGIRHADDAVVAIPQFTATRTVVAVAFRAIVKGLEEERIALRDDRVNRVNRVDGVNGVDRIDRIDGRDDVEFFFGKEEVGRHVLVPDVVGERGIVDEGVAVLLQLIDTFLACHLPFAHRVLLVPLEQHLQEVVVVDGRILLLGERANHIARVLPLCVVPDDGIVEVDAGKVALVLVAGLKHHISFGVPTRLHARVAVGHSTRHDAQRIVALSVVGRTIRGKHLEQVGTRSFGCTTTPPSLRSDVFLVHARGSITVAREVAFFGAIVVEDEVLACRVLLTFHEVGIRILLPQFAIVEHVARAGFHHAVQRHLQLSASFVVDGVVVVGLQLRMD